MEMMQLASMFMKQFADKNNDGQVDMSEAIGTLSRLFSGSSSTPTGSGSGFDLGSLVSKMQGSGSGLSDIVGSWLGDGKNKAISGQQIGELFGSDKVNEFASSLNIDANSAQDKLADLVPEMVDKSSSGGQLSDLLGAVGGLEGIGKMLGGKF